MLFTPSFFFNTSPPPPKYILLYFMWAGRKGPFSFLVGSDLETNELVNRRDRGVRACLHAWVGRRVAPSLEMSWGFTDQMHLVHLPMESLSFSGHLPLRAPTWSCCDQGKEAERDKGQKNAQRWLWMSNMTEVSREKSARGISRAGMSVPTRHTHAGVLYTEA